MNTPLVSIYIVTWNRLSLLKRALASTLNQSHRNIEIIISDNASTDGTADYVKALQKAHSNIKYLQHKENHGACFARNAAIKIAEGKYVTGLDDDDEMLPNRVASLLSAYQPESSFAFADDIYSQNGHQFRGGKRKARPNLNDLLFRNCIGNQVLSEKYKFLEAGLFDTSLKAAQDYDMWLRMIQCFGPAIKSSAASQIIYLDPHQRISNNNWGKFNGYLSFYRKHKFIMSPQQRAHQLLMIKSLCREKISLKMYCRLFSLTCIRAKTGIFWRNIIKPRAYKNHA